MKTWARPGKPRLARPTVTRTARAFASGELRYAHWNAMRPTGLPSLPLRSRKPLPSVFHRDTDSKGCPCPYGRLSGHSDAGPYAFGVEVPESSDCIAASRHLGWGRCPATAKAAVLRGSPARLAAKGKTAWVFPSALPFPAVLTLRYALSAQCAPLARAKGDGSPSPLVLPEGAGIALACPSCCSRDAALHAPPRPSRDALTHVAERSSNTPSLARTNSAQVRCQADQHRPGA
jgi:hypothetical protein